MAQDIHAALGLGMDGKHIATVDADGVALGAIQGLNQKLGDLLRNKEARNTALEVEILELKEVVTKIAGDKN